MSVLQLEFGTGCVAFINGNGRVDGVRDAGGRPRTMTGDRASAAEAFNEGRVRFLVSTEAGGEGIDLQENCHTLIHVDLPWNPMRLHQGVGRLNRYGQTQRVEVLALRNPDTVEARIWEKLDEKVGRIMRSLGLADGRARGPDAARAGHDVPEASPRGLRGGGRCPCAGVG